jgi:methionyl aminopeptidase
VTNKPRTLRSEREIEAMRPAGLAVHRALEIAQQHARPGATTGQIDGAVAEYFKSLGADPLFLNYPNPSPGKPAFPSVTCISVNEEVVHGIPGPRVLVEGDIVSIDTGCRLHGWCGDSAVTLPIGQIEPEIQRLLAVTRGVLELSIELMAKKQWWSQVAAEMATFVRDSGFYVVESFVGHGIGRQMHEEPQVPNFVSPQLRRGGDFRLEPGLVIAIEPMVNFGTKKVIPRPDHWTQATADNRASAHYEHTVAVTEQGIRVLTEPPKPAEQLPAAV